MVFIIAAEWPEASPSKHEEHVISIVCGNTHLHWAVHSGKSEDFAPVLFWRTPPLLKNELQDDACAVLDRHVPRQAHDLIFGENALPTKDSAAKEAASRPFPALTVYVVSTNKEHETAIGFLFKDIPVRIYQLSSPHFFTKDEGAYEGIGVDRVGGLYFYKEEYEGRPVLMFDAGTAWTYTVLDPKGSIIGGGISPGVNARFRAMADYCGNLPVIDHKKYHAALKEKLQKPELFPIFAKDTKTAMITSVFSEIANQCRYLVKHFLEQFKDTTDPELKPIIAIAGGDSPFLQKILQKDFSGVIANEPGTAMPVDAFELHEMKHLVHYGIGKLLSNKVKTPSGPDDELRELLMGQRVARDFPGLDYDGESTYRGSIILIKDGNGLHEDLFNVRYDDGDGEELDLSEIYDALKLYLEVGEKEIDDKPWVAEKKERASKTIEELANKDPKLREGAQKRADAKEAERKLELEVEERKQQALANKRTLPPVSEPNKKARNDQISNEGKKSMYLNKRIAKEFEEEGEDGQIVRNIYYGTIDEVIESPKMSDWLWHVAYDDDDEEELDEREVKSFLKFYAQHSDNDPRLAEIADASKEAGKAAETIVVVEKLGNGKSHSETSETAPAAALVAAAQAGRT